MMPVLFKIPGLGWDITTYGFCLMVGFLLSIMWAVRRALRSGANPDVVLNCGFLALLGGVGGARAMYVVHYWEQQFAHRGSTWQVIKGVIDIREGGVEVYGGFIAVVVLVLLYLWLGRHSIRWYLDIMAPSAALGMSIGRIGCFLNGCCFGGACDLPWAVRFPFGSPATRQQWTDHVPGAALPRELLVFPPDGISGDGLAASPLPRESLRSSDERLEQARQAYDKIRQAQQWQATAGKSASAAEKQRMADELLAIARLGLTPAEEMAAQAMSRNNISAAELRRLADEHRSVAVHPSQLYSTINLGLLALLLSAVYWRRTRDGQVICTMLFVEPITRVLLEIVRADNPEDVKIPWLPVPLTISQFLAICLSAIGLIGLLLLRRMPPRSPRAVRWEPPENEATAKAKAKKPASP